MHEDSALIHSVELRGEQNTAFKIHAAFMPEMRPGAFDVPSGISSSLSNLFVTLFCSPIFAFLSFGVFIAGMQPGTGESSRHVDTKGGLIPRIQP